MTSAAEHARRPDRESGTGRPASRVGEPEAGSRAEARRLAAGLKLDFIEIGAAAVAPSVLALVPAGVARERRVLPIGVRGRVLRVAVADPLDLDAIDELGPLSGLEVEVCVAAEDDIEAALERNYPPPAGETGATAADAAAGVPANGSPRAAAAPAAANDEAPVIRLVHSLLREAVRRRASDIHVEPLERRLRVRMRIDGVLVEVESPAKRLQAAVISRIKIMAGLSIAERRVPQDGRIHLPLGGRGMDLRVSTIPTMHGESAVLRLLERGHAAPDLGGLGLADAERREMEKLIASPDGLILVTGPTGSGKTTTLYAALEHLNRVDRKVITVEEPVECQLPGVNQVPVNRATGLTFASALRAMLRQAPNVVMVGEIRDAETATIAANAALTGHLVFSTLHTNDAAGAVTRLRDLGVPPFLLAASLRAVLAQRLVRRVCDGCRRPHEPKVDELRLLGIGPAGAAGSTPARGDGCPACLGTGYRGRTGLFELLVVDDVLRERIYENVTTASLRACARRAGRRTMREDGVCKVLAGQTTIEEVVGVLTGDVPQKLQPSPRHEL